MIEREAQTQTDSRQVFDPRRSVVLTWRDEALARAYLSCRSLQRDLLEDISTVQTKMVIVQRQRSNIASRTAEKARFWIAQLQQDVVDFASAELLVAARGHRFTLSPEAETMLTTKRPDLLAPEVLRPVLDAVGGKEWQVRTAALIVGDGTGDTPCIRSVVSSWLQDAADRAMTNP